MGNRYNSSVRTFTARNVVWLQSGIAAFTPKIMAAPADLTIATTDLLYGQDLNGTGGGQFVQYQWPLETDNNRNSCVSIKRFGIFCNFADGLVLEQNTARMSMYIEVQNYTIATDPTALSSCSFSVGDNFISNIVDPGGFLASNSPDGYGNILLAESGSAKYPYYYDPTIYGGDKIAISDYSEVNAVMTPMKKLVQTVPMNHKQYEVKVIDALNYMYESEAFMNIVPASAGEYTFINARLTIAGSPLKLYTKTVDTSFNGLPVSFDIAVELEVTQ
jgi:hypothetical protein